MNESNAKKRQQMCELLEKQFSVEKDPLVSAAILDLLHKICFVDGSLLFHLRNLSFPDSYAPTIAIIAKNALCRVYRTKSISSPLLSVAPHLSRGGRLFPKFPKCHAASSDQIHVAHALSLAFLLSTVDDSIQLAEDITEALSKYDCTTKSWPSQAVSLSHEVFQTMDSDSLFLVLLFQVLLSDRTVLSNGSPHNGRNYLWSNDFSPIL